MPGAYLDTGLFVALVFTDDEYHDRAIELVKQLIKGDYGRPLQTSFAVVIETAGMIHRKSTGSGKEQRAFEKVSKIFSFIEGYKIELNFLAEDWMEHAKRLYEERKGFLDFVDALNIAYLRNNNVNQIISFDSDYDQFTGEGIIRIC